VQAAGPGGWRARGDRGDGRTRAAARQPVPCVGWGRPRGGHGASAGSRLGWLRGGAGTGASSGSPRWARIRAIPRGAAMVAPRRSRPPQAGHARTSRPKLRRNSSALATWRGRTCAGRT
jgi:hypothetical protein